VDQIIDCNTRGINEICDAADNFCYSETEYIYDIYSGRDEYDVRELTPDPFPPEFYVDYLNTPKVQAAVGAFQNYSESSNAVGTAFATTGDDNRKLQTVADMLKLVEAGLTVIMYTGDADYICNWLGGEVVSNEIGAPNFHKAGYTNISTSDGVVHGQVKQAGKFSFLRIYESGHEVPFYQPVVALEMFERALKGLDIATGKKVVGKNYLTKGTVKSTYIEGNSTIQFKVVDPDATYNTTTNKPNPPSKSGGGRMRNKKRHVVPFGKTL
jgi:carboxypeptidase C (cathepsin A)